MKRIYKYEIQVTDHQRLDVPEDAAFRALQEQNGALYAWFEVDPDKPLVQRTFRLYGTGHPLDLHHGAYMYRGTVQQREFVWHLYEVPFATRERAA